MKKKQTWPKVTRLDAMSDGFHMQRQLSQLKSLTDRTTDKLVFLPGANNKIGIVSTRQPACQFHQKVIGQPMPYGHRNSIRPLLHWAADPLIHPIKPKTNLGFRIQIVSHLGRITVCIAAHRITEKLTAISIAACIQAMHIPSTAGAGKLKIQIPVSRRTKPRNIQSGNQPEHP